LPARPDGDRLLQVNPTHRGNPLANMSTILVIDDDDTIRTLLTDILESAGYQVVSASDGQEAIDIYRSKSVDLVLTDLVMPNKEGLETIIEFTKSYPGIKIIAMTGLIRRESLRTAKLLGAKRVLCKPFSLPELLEVVSEVLQGR
jgi:CheY-like chemotaxis protein